MKRSSLVSVCAGFSVLALAGMVAFAQVKGTRVAVTGEVVDLWCYLEHGDHGAKHKDCAVACAKAGNPVGIVDAKGIVYVAMGFKEHQVGRDLLIKKMSQTVTATGSLVTKGGMQVLYITSVK